MTCEHGGTVRVGSAFTPDQCRVCWQRAHRPPATAPAPALPARIEWVSTARLAADAVLLAAKLPPTVSRIVGMPRSGLIPAAVVATILNLPLWEVHGKAIRPVAGGSRQRTLTNLPGDVAAVIDDTVYSGAAMARARQAVPGKAVLAAVYVRPEARHSVDHFVRPLSSPHILEWNVANNGPFVGFAADPSFRGGVACDFDGVVCHDDKSGGAPGSPYLVPRARPIRLVVTGRAESLRAGTEAWMKKWGVKADKLVMRPDGDPADDAATAAFKAEHFRASACGFFLESEPAQAEAIARLAGRPVICPRAERVYR